MIFIRFLTSTFIDVFGITHPTPKQERVATLFISTLLGLIVFALLALLVTLYSLSHRAL